MKIGNRNAGFALIVLDKELCREVCLARIHTAYTAIHTIPTIFHAATHTINNYAVFPHSNPDCDSQSKSCSALTHQLILRLTGQVMQHTHSTRGVATHTPIHATTRKANHATQFTQHGLLPLTQNKSCSALTHQLMLRLTEQIMQLTHSARSADTHNINHAVH